jgi:hypothetical protein
VLSSEERGAVNLAPWRRLVPREATLADLPFPSGFMERFNWIDADGAP